MRARKKELRVNGDAPLRPRVGDATAQADLPSATGPPAEGKALADMRGLMLRRCGHATLDEADHALQSVHGLRLDWEIPSPHARQERLASSVRQLWRLAETKKPGPSLL